MAHLPPGTRMGVIDAFARSLHSVFLWSIPLAIVAFVLALFLREIPLRKTFGDAPVAAPAAISQQTQTGAPAPMAAAASHAEQPEVLV